MGKTKDCVACAEPILEKARLCKHCGTLQSDERFRDAHEEPSPADLIGEAIAQFEKGKFAEGVRILQPMVDEGDLLALANAGWAYHDMGDDKSAVRLLEQAASGGEGNAMWSLVRIFDEDGSPKSSKKQAIRWLIKLVEDFDDSNAMYHLYCVYLELEDEETALVWLGKAVSAGNPVAKEELKEYDLRPVRISIS